VDVAAWARAQNLDDPNLLEYAAYGRAHFDATTSSGQAESVTALELEPDVKETLLQLTLELNARYYAGEDPPELTLAQAEALDILRTMPSQRGERILTHAQPDGVDDRHWVWEGSEPK
jgi:hypothetical protein